MVQQHNILKITLSLLLMLIGMLPAAAQNVVLQESFDNFDGWGGNDGLWSNLELQNITTGDLPNGWNISPQDSEKQTVRKANKCACIGATLTQTGISSDSGNAYLETPAIAVPGKYMLYFKAGALQTSNEKEVMQVIESTSGTIDIEQSQFKITKGAFSDFSTKIIVKKGNASIRFGNVYRKNNRFLLDEIKIVKVESTSSIDPEFSFSQSTCTVSWTNGDAIITSPTLNTNVDTDKITFSSSQENVATVDAKGVVTVHNEGTTTITATFGGDDNFNAATASYTLNVVKGNYTYKRTTTFEAGKAYLIVSEDSNGNCFLANPIAEDSKGMPLVKVSQTASNIIVSSANSYDEYLIRFVTSSQSYALQSLKTSHYISINSSNDFIYTSARSQTWTIEDNPFGEDGRFIVTSNERFLRMSKGNNTNDFRTYSGESLGRPIFLYEKVTTPPSGTIKISAKEGYGTFYSDKSIIMPEGLCGATVTDVEENGKLKYNWKYNAGDVVPAHTGLLLYASQPGSFDYYEATESTNAMQKASGLDQTNDVVGGDGTQGGTPDETQEVNYLHGTTADETIAEDETLYKFYQLSYGTINGTRTIGFFFENAQGGVFLNKANKAYLSIPRNISAQSAFSLERNNPIMSITEQLQQAQGVRQIFDISGNRIPTTGHLQKGIYIVNGQKMIIR